LPQVPAWPRVQSRSTFSCAGAAPREYQNELSRFSIRRQGSSFLPSSSLRALSGRVAHPPERLPCSLSFRALRPTRPANSPPPAPHKPTQSSCAAKPRPRVAGRGGRGRSPSAGELVRTAPHDAAGRQRMASTRGGHAKLVSAHRIGTAAIGR
jgi:hypothetical protein